MGLFKTQRYEKQTKTLGPFRLLLVKVHQSEDFKNEESGMNLRVFMAGRSTPRSVPSKVWNG
jgi:hypothetical protein